MERDLGVVVLFEVENQVADPLLAERDLVVVFLVHEDVAVAVFVEVLHVARVEVGLLDLVFGVDALVGDEARLEVFQLEAQLGRQVARRLEIAVQHLAELALFDDDHAAAEFDVCNGRHESLRLLIHLARLRYSPVRVSI